MAGIESPIEYTVFSRVDMRVGRIVRVEDFPKAKNPSYRMWVDFGEFALPARAYHPPFA